MDIRNFFQKKKPKDGAKAATSAAVVGANKAKEEPTTPSTIASDDGSPMDKHSSRKLELQQRDCAFQKSPGILNKAASSRSAAGATTINDAPAAAATVDAYPVKTKVTKSFPGQTLPRAKKRRVENEKEKSENNVTAFNDSEEEEEAVSASRRRKTAGKSKVTRRAILDDSSDEEMQESNKSVAKPSVQPAARKEVKERMEVDEPTATKNTEPSPAKKLKPAPTESAPTTASNLARRSNVTSAPPAASAWGSLMMDRGQSSSKTKKKSKQDDNDFKLPGGASRVVRAAACQGNDLPVITEPQKMFDDMVSVQLTDNGTNGAVLLPMLQNLHGRPLRVATMCSGTESPILALDMLTKSIEDYVYSHRQQFDGLNVKDDVPILQIEHIFSCEIEPFKQAYIERNFHPPLLFRDIRELGRDKAHTAFGALVDVPCQPGCVDLLIAGTSCVDYSNLNNEKKTIKEGGESGQTWRGLVQWIKKAQPPIVILENVKGAPWTTKVKIFESIGYHASFIHVDTKQYYIPHTRQRGYLFAVKKSGAKPISKRVLKQWSDTVKKLERPAGGSLDAFMLPNDDPRVIKGRDRLSATDSADQSTPWTKCQSRHHFARANEELGEKHPLTGSNEGNTRMPPFAWNEWTSRQVLRIHDLLDIDTLRCAKEGIDPTTKSMVWDLSQNVDRDTIGRLGLSQCLTPSGVPYVSNRGGVLVGEELLLLQGIPAEDLILTKETEKNLKDLAGNAMSTTVVGACMLGALLFGQAAIGTDDRMVPESSSLVSSLVPRPMQLASGKIKVTRELAKYEKQPLILGPLEEIDVDKFRQMLKDAASSSRMCVTEGLDKALPFSSLLQCKLCGFTCSKACAKPLPSKWEEHVLVDMDRPDDIRVNPFEFRSTLLSALPMRVALCSFSIESIRKPPEVDAKLWKGWKAAAANATQSFLGSDSASKEYRFTELTRSNTWTVIYMASSGSRLELQISEKNAIWFLFTPTPAAVKGAFRDSLLKPIARMAVQPVAGNIFTNGTWEICLPTSSSVEVLVKGVGETKPSWRALLGLKGEYDSEVRFEKLQISVQTDGFDDIKSKIDGEYLALPKCGGACGSMHKRQGDGVDGMYFFLDSGRCTLGDDDTFVFSANKHRTSYGESRDIVLRIDKKSHFRPEFQSKHEADRKSQSLQATVNGSWIVVSDASLQPVLHEIEENCSTLLMPVKISRIALSNDGWKSCPSILEARVPLGTGDFLFTECQRLLARAKESAFIEVNLQKSSSIFRSLAFATSRLGVPKVTQSWIELDSDVIGKKNDEEIACESCAPKKPDVKWTLVQKGKTIQFLPIEDGQLQARYEHNMKHRPDAWLVTLQIPGKDKSMESVDIKIGVNAVSLAHRALGLFPLSTLARRAMIDASTSAAGISNRANMIFDWRVISHVEKQSADSGKSFPRLVFTSNKTTEPASQPPEFESRNPLRPEQLRSLSWMLSQEASSTPFYEEEVVEAMLSNLNWRAEGRAKRPVLVRGGIVADEVGYGKTAITLGLIDAAPKVNGKPPAIPEHLKQSHLHTKATLVIVPSHLMGQWPREISKFLGSSKVVVTIKDIGSFNKLTVNDILQADIVIVNFSVLSGNNKYFPRLAHFAGVNTSSLPKGSKGGRHFDDVYKECLVGLGNRVASHREDCSAAFEEIENDAEAHESLATEEHLRLDGKKSVYKSLSEKQVNESGSTIASKSKPSAKGKASASDVDPWELRSSKVKSDIKNMKSPPLEMFFWNRVVVDEFTYLLEKADRARVQSLVLGLNSSYRWGLSATPPHETFDDIKSLASLMGIHLGINEPLPGVLSKKRGGSKEDQETSASEKFSSLLEVRSMQWHERRHRLGQEFLNKFVRQNIAEIDEIKCEEHLVAMDLPAAERGIYLEMNNYLKSLEMNSKKALKSKKESKGDRENRTQRILENSGSAEEALLKRCTHFNIGSAKSSTALEACDLIISQRKIEQVECENELMESIAAAVRQRNLILKHDKNWKGMSRTEKGEVEDTLERYVVDVQNRNSIQGGADEEIHCRIQDILKLAEEDVKRAPHKDDGTFAEANGDVEEEDDENDRESIGKKRKKKDDAQIVYSMKFALRNHMHKVRALSKELRGRMQALRYFQWVRKTQLENAEIECIGHGSTVCECKTTSGKVPRDRVGVLSSCGHVGCLSCLEHHADREDCIEPSCQVPVKRTHIASAAALGVDRSRAAGGKYGAKLTAIVKKVKELVEGQDRVILFVQFDDLKEKVAEALQDSGVKSLQVQGSVANQIKALDVLQKETPAKDDPRVLLLTMDDESSAGVNLTTCNHAIFVHPLLAESQQQYNAYETQAIGRIRRYGQTKTVHIWRFIARDTIDSEIYEERTGKKLSW